MRFNLTILLLVACSSTSSRTERPDDSESSSSAKPARLDQPVEPVEQPALKNVDSAKPASKPAGQLGYAQIPDLPSSAEYKGLQEALNVHRSGDHKASRNALLVLWKRSPDKTRSYERTRYNLACAQSLVGEFAEATMHMQALLQKDLPHYRGRLAEDKDFEKLRNSPSFSGLTQRIAELEPAWKEAARGGLPMIAWRGQLAGKDGGYIRAGVWNTTSSRFVPLGRRVKNTIGAIVDLPNQRSLTLSRHKPSKAVKRDYEDEVEFTLRLEVHPLYGETPAVFTMRPAIATDIEAFPVADGLHLRWLADYGMMYIKHTLWKHVRSPVKRDAMETGQGYKLHIPEIPPRPYLYSQGSIAILRDGGQTNFPGLQRYQWTSGRTKGYRLRSNALGLPDKRKIPLSKGHGLGWANNLLIDDTSTYAWVVSLQGNCKHLVDRVHLPSGKVTQVGKGKGLAAARLHGGHLYLQLGATTKVFDGHEEGWDDGKTLPENLGFVHPKCK